MAKVSTLTEHDTLRLILDCKSQGRNQDSFLLVKDMTKKEHLQLFPSDLQKSLSTYLSSSQKFDVLIRKG